eukprot:1736215-Pyramimonas_sp.AAC.1
METQARIKTTPIVVDMRAATFNVQSMRQVHRRGTKGRNRARRAAALRTQMHRRGVVLLGVQE